MAKRRKRRKWSDDEKRMICAQTLLPSVSVAQVARRYDVNANQVFNWLKDPRFAPPAKDDAAELFLPIEVIEPINTETACAATHSEITVELAGGHRLRVTGCYDPDALATLIRKLST